MQSVKKLFSASLLSSKQNRPPFLVLAWSWFPHKYFHTFHTCCETNPQNELKISEKNKISLKSIFFYSPVHIIFKVNFQLWDILQYNTLSMMCILVTGLKWRPQGGTENKQRASVKLYWLPWPLTACRPPKYPVSASVQSTNSTKVFDALSTCMYL